MVYLARTPERLEKVSTPNAKWRGELEEDGYLVLEVAQLVTLTQVARGPSILITQRERPLGHACLRYLLYN